MHGCNLGVPGNINTTLKQIKAVEGKPMHLTHIQYHSYDNQGDRNFSPCNVCDVQGNLIGEHHGKAWKRHYGEKV